MCTLVVLHRCFPDAPLIVAANRDEYYERPAEPPRLWDGVAPRLLAPRDAREGGTWLGVNETGVFAGLTNRPVSEPDRTRRSRGHLVTESLGARSAAEAADRLASLAPGHYNPFNLIVADGQEAFVAVYEGRVNVTELLPGPHVLGNADPNCADVPKVARILGEAEKVAAGRSDDALERLATLSRTHLTGATPLEATCIHAGPYGTRCSTLIRLGGDPDAEQFRFADGPPCETEYEDLSPLLKALDSSTGSSEFEEGSLD